MSPTRRAPVVPFYGLVLLESSYPSASHYEYSSDRGSLRPILSVGVMKPSARTLNLSAVKKFKMYEVIVSSSNELKNCYPVDTPR